MELRERRREDAIHAVFLREKAQEAEADAAEAQEAGYPDIAAEALAEARYWRQQAAEARKAART